MTGKAMLGTHTMEVTVYHRRESQSYVPLAHSCSAFTITGKDSGRGRARCKEVKDGEAWPYWKEEKGKGKMEWGKGKWCVTLKGQSQEDVGGRMWGFEPVKVQSA